jgi:hypothetical protein
MNDLTSRLQYGPVAPNGGIFTADLLSGDVILAPTDFGTRTAERTVAKVEVVGSNDFSIEFTEGPSMEADGDEIWPVPTATAVALDSRGDLGGVLVRAGRVQRGDVVLYADEDGKPVRSEFRALVAVSGGYAMDLADGSLMIGSLDEGVEVVR